MYVVNGYMFPLLPYVPPLGVLACRFPVNRLIRVYLRVKSRYTILKRTRALHIYSCIVHAVRACRRVMESELFLGCLLFEINTETLQLFTMLVCVR